jgi:threonyl-tRNA synthetase
MLEEAEKRDHRKLGREMDLFHFQEEGPGTVFWHAKGWRMFQNLSPICAAHRARTYEEVNAPQVLDKSLWEDLRPLGLVLGEHVRRVTAPTRWNSKTISVCSRSSR